MCKKNRNKSQQWASHLGDAFHSSLKGKTSLAVWCGEALLVNWENEKKTLQMCSWKIHDIIPNERQRAGESELRRSKNSEGSKLGLISNGFQWGMPQVSQMKGNSGVFLRGSRFHPLVPPLRSRGERVCVWGSLWWQRERCVISSHSEKSVRVCVSLTGAEVTLRFRWSQNVIMPQWTKGESNTKQLDVFDSDSRHIDRGMNSSLPLSLSL